MRYRVDPRRVKKVVMKDGTAYPVGRSGLVSVTRPDHLIELSKRRGDALNAEIVMHEAAYLAPRVVGRTCPSCGFGAWSWQTDCPKCETRLSAD